MKFDLISYADVAISNDGRKSYVPTFSNKALLL